VGLYKKKYGLKGVEKKRFWFFRLFSLLLTRETPDFLAKESDYIYRPKRFKPYHQISSKTCFTVFILR